MATKTTTLLVDDVTGGDADETIEFGVDGVVYEIDLSETNAEALRSAMQPWVEAGRRSGGAKRAAATTGRSGYRGAGASTMRGGDGNLNRAERDALRVWAEANDYHVAPRGRISSTVVDEWTAAGRPGA